MRTNERFARQLVQSAGETLSEPPAVDEDQRRAMRINEIQQAWMNCRPDRRTLVANGSRTAGDIVGRRELGHILDRQVDRELECLLLTRIDDGDGPIVNGASAIREFGLYFTPNLLRVGRPGGVV